MKPEVDSDRQDIFDHMTEDMAKNRKEDPPMRRQRSSQNSGTAGRFTLILGLGAVILVLFIILVLRGSGKQDMTPIQSRLDQIENRLAVIDGNVRNVEALENELKSLQQAQGAMEAREKTMGERLDRIAKQLEKAPTPTPTPAAAPRASAPAKTEVHEVRPGDTLFGIAGKYGITLDQLLRLNNLSRNATLRPGQKLLIAPAGR
jgi:LysM repeat protein